MLKKFFKAPSGRVEEFCANPLKTVIFITVLLALFFTVQSSLLQSIISPDTLDAFSRGARGFGNSSNQLPLSGYLVHTVSILGNHKDWILYLAGNLCIAISVIYLYKTARLFYDDFTSGTAAILGCGLAFCCAPFLGFSEYTIEMMLVTITAYNFFCALKDDKLINWIALSIFCVAGLLNKYTFITVIVAYAIVFFCSKSYYRHLKNLKFYVSLLATLILLIPYYNQLTNSLQCLNNWQNGLSCSAEAEDIFGAASMMISPFLIVAILIFSVWLPQRRTLEPLKIDRSNGIKFLLTAIIPALLLTVLMLFCCINLKSFCALSTLPAIAIISFFPFRIEKKFFARVVVLLEAFMMLLMIASTVYLLRCSNLRNHSNPEVYIKSALNFYTQNSIINIPAAAGTRFEAELLEKYLPAHPPACVFGDDIALEHYRKQIKQEGALLIFTPDKNGSIPKMELDNFLKNLHYTETPPIKFARIVYFYKAKWGKRQKQVFYLGYLPPEDGTQSINITPVKVK